MLWRSGAIAWREAERVRDEGEGESVAAVEGKE
jgi:hypothetical protein